MATKKFMANEPGYVYNPNNQSAAETARLRSNTQNESQAESNRLARQEKTLYAAKVGGGRGLAQVPQSEGGLGGKSPYYHNTDDVVANGAGASDTIPLNIKFDPNMLDAYDTVTYHWKLFITTENASTTGKVFDTSNQIIIAETGVSDLTIDKVEINSNATPTIETGTGTVTTIKFEILEPAGAGLVDKIFYQSLAMGIGNWNSMPFYLQLKFRARTPDASEAENGAPGDIGNLKWLWPLRLTSIAANVTTMGTRYEFAAILYDELAQSNLYFTTQHVTVLPNLDDFFDAMAKLQDALNEDQIFKLIDNNGIPDSYRIVVDPVLGSKKITPVNSSTNSKRADTTVSFNGKNASFTPGTAIDKIIDGILSNMPEIQKEFLGSTTAGAEGLPMNQEVNQMKKFWRITTETRPIKFDTRRTDFAREFTIYVYSYNIGVVDSNTFQSSAPPLTLDAERRRLATYVKNNILKKKYNYIYTGLNDQIINFDIRINNAFAAVLNRMGGVYYNSSMNDMGMVAQQHAAAEAEVTSKLRKHLSLLNTSTASDIQRENSRKDLQSSVQNAKVSDEKKTELEKLIASTKPESKLNFIRSLQQSGGSRPTGFVARDLTTPRDEKLAKKDIRFISDVDQSSDAAAQAYADYAKLLKGTLRPIARVDGMQNRQAVGMESNSNSGLQKLSSMFAVALHSNMDGSYAQMTVTIKGDPFWLHPKPYSQDNPVIYNSLGDDSDAIRNLKYSHYKNRAANLYGTDNFIILRFRTPKIYDVEYNTNGEDNTTDVETFSGVFKVITVKNTFEKGVFRQELYCHLDPEINILNFKKEIEENAKTRDVMPPVVDISSDQIPEQFSKTSRLVELNDIPVSGVSDQAAAPAPRGPARTSNVPVGKNFSVPGTRGIIG